MATRDTQRNLRAATLASAASSAWSGDFFVSRDAANTELERLFFAVPLANLSPEELGARCANMHNHPNIDVRDYAYLACRLLQHVEDSIRIGNPNDLATGQRLVTHAQSLVETIVPYHHPLFSRVQESYDADAYNSDGTPTLSGIHHFARSVIHEQNFNTHEGLYGLGLIIDHAHQLGVLSASSESTHRLLHAGQLVASAVNYVLPIPKDPQVYQRPAVPYDCAPALRLAS